MQDSGAEQSIYKHPLRKAKRPGLKRGGGRKEEVTFAGIAKGALKAQRVRNSLWGTKVTKRHAILQQPGNSEPHSQDNPDTNIFSH